MASFVQVLCMMSMASGLDASKALSTSPFSKQKPRSFSDSSLLPSSVHTSLSDKQLKETVAKEGKNEFGKRIELELAQRMQKATADIESLDEGEDRKFWMQMLKAYEVLDVNKMEFLQNRRKSDVVEEQVLIVDFICAAQSSLESHKDDIVLPSMANIKKSSFFTQITTQENTASN